MKRDGLIFELEFRLAALKEGFDVFPAEGDYSLVDCMLLNQAGKSYRVQVKGTGGSVKSDGKGRKASGNKFQIIPVCGTDKRSYRATEVDVLACWVDPRREWFLLPMIQAQGKSTLAFFCWEGSKSQWEKYRNNWDIFRS